MYREYNDQWRQLDAVKCVQRIQWSMKAIRCCKNMYRECNGQWKSRKRQINVQKTIHRKLEIEQHEPH